MGEDMSYDKNVWEAWDNGDGRSHNDGYIAWPTLNGDAFFNRAPFEFEVQAEYQGFDVPLAEAWR